MFSRSSERRVRVVAGLDDRRVVHVVERQEREQPPHFKQRVLFVLDGEVRDAAARGVGDSAAEVLLRDVLARDRTNHVGAGNEHLRRALRHEDEVGERRRVDRAAGARPHDHRDLRHDAGCPHVAQEDIAVAAEAGDALLDARAAGVVEADDRRAGLQRQVHHLRHLLAHRLGQRAAEDREVLREDEDAAAVDLAVARDDGVAQVVLLVEAELGRAVHHQLVHLLERAGVEENVEPLAGRELPALVLRLDALQAAAKARLVLHFEEPLATFCVCHAGIVAKAVSWRQGTFVP